MKKVSLVAACLLLVLMLTACGMGTDEKTTLPTEKPTQTTERETTLPPSEAEETEPSEETQPASETQAPTEDTNVEAVDIDRMIYAFPILEEIGGAKLQDVVQDQDGLFRMLYENGSAEDLEEYLYYCATCGLYANAVDMGGDVIVYDLYPLGVSFYCRIALDPANGDMEIILENPENVVSWEQLENHLAYYEQEISFPAEFGKNVFPQFNASIGQTQPMGRVGSDVDYLFDGGAFWNEWYSEVSYGDMRKYVNEMILCGFDVRLVAGQMDDTGALMLAVLHFSNGDADVAVMYDFGEEDASYYTEGGTIWTLLTGEDYTRYIPQK